MTPTGVPSVTQPTAQPTIGPSPAPSTEPTTSAPSSVPTHLPTAAPSLAPTMAPTPCRVPDATIRAIVLTSYTQQEFGTVVVGRVMAEAGPIRTAGGVNLFEFTHDCACACETADDCESIRIVADARRHAFPFKYECIASTTALDVSALPVEPTTGTCVADTNSCGSVNGVVFSAGICNCNPSCFLAMDCCPDYLWSCDVGLGAGAAAGGLSISGQSDPAIGTAGGDAAEASYTGAATITVLAVVAVVAVAGTGYVVRRASLSRRHADLAVPFSDGEIAGVDVAQGLTTQQWGIKIEHPFDAGKGTEAGQGELLHKSGV